MHVLICSYEFDLGSEGICTGRLVRALLDAGCQITLVTSPTAKTAFAHERLDYRVVSQTPLRPAKFFFHLAPILGHIPTRFCYVWSRRVARLRLERPPDLVYGRAHPFQSVAGAHGLASRCRLPLFTHFSDPMPSPFWEKGHPEYARTLSGVCRLISDSQALTLTTREAISFEEAMVGKLDGKAFVLNHVAPAPTFLPLPQRDIGKVFGYFGLFYGNRNASVLLRGFAQHLRKQPKDRLLFVGTEPSSVLPEAASLGIETAVRVMGRVDDVRCVMAEVDVLVATDSFSSAPVFLSTKLVEYLVVNRSVMLISPEDSPGAKLLSRFPQTTTLVSKEQASDVSEGLARSAACATDDSPYKQRFAQMVDFSPKAVAGCLLEKATAGIR